ncbi:hypothetical protein [Singulisphaera sp. PoT]|uniref:hypothetical protein n=1 Tax=Singulisphaera sp. PoT TaxID=3411797 RepID=UPI003BF565BA
MLDVVLYRHDRKGRLCLDERIFATFGNLILFFSSEESQIWEWAEVSAIFPRRSVARGTVVRYSASQLRQFGRQARKGGACSRN